MIEPEVVLGLMFQRSSGKKFWKKLCSKKKGKKPADPNWCEALLNYNEVLDLSTDVL